VLIGKATNTNLMVFGLALSGIEHTIYCTRVYIVRIDIY